VKGCSGPCSGTLALSALFPRDNQQLRLPAHPHTAGLKRHRPASRGVSCSREDVCSRETSAPRPRRVGRTAHTLITLAFAFDFGDTRDTPIMSRWNLLGGAAVEEPEPGLADRLKDALGMNPRAGNAGMLADLRSSLRPAAAAEDAGSASFLSGIQQSLDRSTRSIQTAVGLREEEPPTLMSELDSATTMSYQTVRTHAHL
jgi:hypothetical protein